MRKDVEYVYLDHAPASVQMTYRKGAFDHFDTVFANGQYQIDEHRATERVYGLKEKKMTPTNIAFRDMAGVSIDTDELDRLPAVLDDIVANPGKFRQRIEDMLARYFFNPGHSGEVAGRYILNALVARKGKRGKDA